MKEWMGRHFPGVSGPHFFFSFPLPPGPPYPFRHFGRGRASNGTSTPGVAGAPPLPSFFFFFDLLAGQLEPATATTHCASGPLIFFFFSFFLGLLFFGYRSRRGNPIPIAYKSTNGSERKNPPLPPLPHLFFWAQLVPGRARETAFWQSPLAGGFSIPFLLLPSLLVKRPRWMAFLADIFGRYGWDGRLKPNPFPLFSSGSPASWGRSDDHRSWPS